MLLNEIHEAKLLACLVCVSERESERGSSRFNLCGSGGGQLSVCVCG